MIRHPRHPQCHARHGWVYAVGLLLTALALTAGPPLAERFRIGVGLQQALCLPPYRVFLIDRHARPRRGDYLAFRSDERLLPWFRPGLIVIKALQGVAGDHVVVADTVQINGQVVATPSLTLGITPLAGALRRQPEEFRRDEIIPAGAGWVMGQTLDSFDSRYWGYVRDEQIIGRAYALW
jgi:conjugal transfer pilin signal peptidase TrbI